MSSWSREGDCSRNVNRHCFLSKYDAYFGFPAVANIGNSFAGCLVPREVLVSPLIRQRVVLDETVRLLRLLRLSALSLLPALIASTKTVLIIRGSLHLCAYFL